MLRNGGSLPIVVWLAIAKALGDIVLQGVRTFGKREVPQVGAGGDRALEGNLEGRMLELELRITVLEIELAATRLKELQNENDVEGP